MRRTRTTVALAGLALAGLPLAAGCGGGSDRRESAGRDAFAPVSSKPASRERDKAAPRWERLATLSGSGSAERRVRVPREAIQWRVRWRCESGRFAVALEPPPATGPGRGAADCPAGGSASFVRTGEVALRIAASSRWRAVVSQQVDTALHERPLAGAEPLARGRFYDIERKGSGSVTLGRLPSGRLALRLEGFRTSPNTDLLVWVSEAPRPRTTKEALHSRHTVIAPLKSTLGDGNYLLPRGFDPSAARSVVIWCEPVQIAYTAATLAR